MSATLRWPRAPGGTLGTGRRHLRHPLSFSSCQLPPLQTSDRGARPETAVLDTQSSAAPPSVQQWP